MAGGQTPNVDWESLGATAAVSLNAVHAVVVLGSDPLAVARVAIGIGRAESKTRRVAIADLIGDVEPIHSLVTGDDPHGVVDSFLYGVSLNKIARQVDDSGMLFVMPTGTEPHVSGEIMRNSRWSRLAGGFREVGALLILAVRSEAEGVRELTEFTDGAVIVGDHSLLPVSRESVLALVEEPRATSGLPSPAIPAPVSPEPQIPVSGSGRAAKVVPPVLLPPREASDANMPVVFPKKRGAPVGIIAASVGVLALAAAGIWYMNSREPSPPVVAAPKPVATAAPAPDTSAAAPAAFDTTSSTRADTSAALRPVNPEDSTKAASYSIAVLQTNDEAAALARWADLGLKLPAGTVSMVRVRGERGRFFQVQAGAYTKAGQADSMLAALRKAGKLGADAGRVMATPYALMLEGKVSRRAAQNVADGYGQREIAAYALLQADGSATIYVGAFESAEESVALMNELKEKGVTATLAFRTGRSF